MVLIFLLSGGFEDMGIFHVFQLSFHGPITDKIDKYVKLPLKRKKKINTWHSLIAFSIVFTNKNEVIDLTPPPIFKVLKGTKVS